MTDFTKHLINSKEVEFLTGQPIPYGVYEKLLSKQAYRAASDKQLANIRFLVSEIIKTNLLKLTSSNDPRYDRKEPIMFAVNQLRERGLSKEVRGDILSDKTCVAKQHLGVKYFILNVVLTDAQLTELYAQLKAKLDYHTQTSPDLMGGDLPAFINFSPKTVLSNINDFKPKKKTNDNKSSRKALGKNANEPV